ncbi:hypothetical protein OGAPHI_001162 [Ogataea philodendri]|uniref:Uncharacterized protein n=1 Tax=Ogataea philodendri TaxID=1378263 RepID=A0A9P8PG49_9ASCO|nr:uncharacterized protein OGAPHI_001162 [Ogataea philodendri]KAH3670647.1 hypothetical protein OGAPHI_001162 [Ogataea philodendri]
MDLLSILLGSFLLHADGSGIFPMSTPAASKPAKSSKDQLLELVKTPQFVWFTGHVSTLLFSLVYFLTFRSKGKAHRLSYNLIFVAVIESFGIIIHQGYKTGTLKVNNPKALLADDNVQYTLIASALLLVLPRISLAIFPFGFFSFFHSINYFRGAILPKLGLKNEAGLSNKLGAFVKNYNDLSMYYAANFEIATFVYIVFKALIWSRGFWIALVVYGAFIKFRYEKSIFTRTCFKKIEVRADGLFSHPSVSPQIKQYWINAKSVIKKYGNQYKLVSEPAKPAKSDVTDEASPDWAALEDPVLVFFTRYGSNFFTCSLSLFSATTTKSSPLPFTFNRSSFSIALRYLAVFFQLVFLMLIRLLSMGGKFFNTWADMNSDASIGVSTESWLRVYSVAFRNRPSMSCGVRATCSRGVAGCSAISSCATCSLVALTDSSTSCGSTSTLSGNLAPLTIPHSQSSYTCTSSTATPCDPTTSVTFSRSISQNPTATATFGCL